MTWQNFEVRRDSQWWLMGIVKPCVILQSNNIIFKYVYLHWRQE